MCCSIKIVSSRKSIFLMSKPAASSSYYFSNYLNSSIFLIFWINIFIKAVLTWILCDGSAPHCSSYILLTNENAPGLFVEYANLIPTAKTVSHNFLGITLCFEAQHRELFRSHWADGNSTVLQTKTSVRKDTHKY